MKSVRRSHTTPELVFRRACHTQGLRYRLHRKDLPGTPDLVFPARALAIFVHGCFWHAHRCRLGGLPITRSEYWRDKLERNIQRDFRNIAELERLGWRVLVVWECETKDSALLEARVQDVAQTEHVR